MRAGSGDHGTVRHCVALCGAPWHQPGKESSASSTPALVPGHAGPPPHFSKHCRDLFRSQRSLGSATGFSTLIRSSLDYSTNYDSCAEAGNAWAKNSTNPAEQAKSNPQRNQVNEDCFAFNISCLISVSNIPTINLE